MTGKELALVFAGATFVAVGAAAATQIALSERNAAPVVADTSALEARLEQMERDQVRTTKALERLSGTVDRVTEQLAAVRTEVAQANERAAQAADGASLPGFTSMGGSGSPRVRIFGEPGATSLDGLTEEQRAELMDGIGELPEMIRNGAAIALSGDDLPEGLRGALDAAMGETLGAEDGPLAGLMKGMQLRRLPEADRWEKARTDLNLASSQVDDLKAATRAYDDEMKNAMVEESRTTEGGATLTIRRTDPAKAGEARRRYEQSVDTALDTEQRKKWREGGYGNAFGRVGGGMGTAISVMSVNQISHGDDGTKSDE